MSLLIFYINNKEKNLLKFFMSYGFLNLFIKILINIYIGLSPINASLSTGICYLLLITTQYFYVKHKMKINLNLFTKRNKIYVVLSLSFIPISYIIRLLNISFLPRVFLIIVVCVLEYCGILILIKDKVFVNVLKKFKLVKGVKK